MKDIELQAERAAFEAWFEPYWSGPQSDLAAWAGWKARAAVEADRAQRVPDVGSTKKDFRWDGERQQHVPQLIVEFEPVPFDGPCNAKGWRDRDAVASMLASTPAQPAQQELEKELEPRMSRACLDAWDKSRFTAGPHDAVHPIFLEAFSAGFKAAAQHQEPPQPVERKPINCWCEACDLAQGNPLGRTRMSLCPECGDKRCPRAKHHDAPCHGIRE